MSIMRTMTRAVNIVSKHFQSQGCKPATITETANRKMLAIPELDLIVEIRYTMEITAVRAGVTDTVLTQQLTELIRP